MILQVHYAFVETYTALCRQLVGFRCSVVRRLRRLTSATIITVIAIGQLFIGNGSQLEKNANKER